jgi:chemotaxis protein histidine kinase CheA
MIALAEQRSSELEQWMGQISAGSDVTSPVRAEEVSLVQDSDIRPEFLEVFIEESDEIVLELANLLDAWLLDPQVNQILRDIRRHFHTFKGNGRAVGANILGELGWAAQDMLDRVLDGDLAPGDRVRELLEEVVEALPGLVASYHTDGQLDEEHTRQLTNRCFLMARSGGNDLAEELPANEAAMAAPVVSAVSVAGNIGQ